MAEARRKQAIRGHFSVDPDDLGKSFREYLERILDARMRLTNLASEIAGIELSKTGYRTQSQLDKLTKKHYQLSEDIDTYHEKMITLRLDELEGVEGSGMKSMGQLEDAISEGTIPREIDRLSEGVIIVGQQLTAKQTAANTRMALTVSLTAALIAALSLAF